MKTETLPMPAPAYPSDELIRDYAYHLYLQSGRIQGRDVDNWLEARACLLANIPIHRAHVRLHSHAARRRARRSPAIQIPSVGPIDAAA